MGKGCWVTSSFFSDHGGKFTTNIHAPFVHEWSRDRMSVTERNAAWDTALVTVARSITHTFQEYSDVQQRRRLLPHIDTLMANDEGRMFATDSNLEERSNAATKFMLAYNEGRQMEKVSDVYGSFRSAYSIPKICRL